MANVLIPFPGAAVRDVEQTVAGPAEQVLAPIIKPKGIDDVPIVTLTLYGTKPATGPYDLERVAHSIESDLKRVPGTREVTTLGGPGRAVMVEIDPARMAGMGVTVPDLRQALQAANLGLPVGDLISGNRAVPSSPAPSCARPAKWAIWWWVCMAASRCSCATWPPCATARHPPRAMRYEWHGIATHDGAPATDDPAVTVTVTKKPGENAIDVANAVMQRVDALRNTVIPVMCRWPRRATTARRPTTRRKSSSRSCCSPRPRWWPSSSSHSAGARPPSWAAR